MRDVDNSVIGGGNYLYYRYALDKLLVESCGINTAIKTRLQQIQARDEIYNADEPWPNHC